MTIDAPEKAAWFEQQRAKMTPAELGELFLVFLAERCADREKVVQNETDEKALAEWDELVAAGKGRLERPYRFSRADAYDEEIA